MQIINGRRRVISTSKIRKIIAIRKKWREKGIREEDLGSNPHSNGEVFSRSIYVFFEIKFTIKIIINTMSKINISRLNKIFNIHTNY